MSWVNELIDLYEINSDKIGVIEYRRDMTICAFAAVSYHCDCTDNSNY